MCFHVVSKTEIQRNSNNNHVLQLNTISYLWKERFILVFRGHLKRVWLRHKVPWAIDENPRKKQIQLRSSHFNPLPLGCFIWWQTVENLSRGVMALWLALAAFGWNWRGGCWMGVVFNCAEQGNCNLLVTKSCMGLITQWNVLTGWLADWPESVEV